MPKEVLQQQYYNYTARQLKITKLQQYRADGNAWTLDRVLKSTNKNMKQTKWQNATAVFIVEADRISFSFLFSAPKNAFFLIFRPFIFSAEKDTHIFSVFYFSVQIWL